MPLRCTASIAAPVNTDYIIVRQKVEPGQDIDWRVKSDVVHTVQLYRARTKPDSMTITLSGIDDTDAATISGVTYAAEDTATDALRSAHKFYTGGADDTADAVELAAGINYGAYVTIGTVAVADTIAINGVLFTAAAAEDIPNGVFHQNGTTTEDAVSLALCINHKDTLTFGSDATTWTATDPAVSEAQSYATSIELMGDLNTHMGSTVFHNQTTAAASSTAATSEATLIAQVIVARNTLLSHLADTAAHNIADTARYATVAATTVPTTAATAIVCENILVTAYKAHIATAVPTATDTVTVNGLTYTAHATTTTPASRQFSVAGTDSDKR